MPLQMLIQFAVVPLLASVAGMGYAAANNQHLLSRLSAALFFITAITVAVIINRPYWPAPPPGTEPAELFHTMRRNTRLAALTYAWGAAAFFAVYGLAGLRWQHGWQYGMGAALIAAALLAYVHRMGKTGRNVPPAPALNALHGLSAGLGLLFLLGTGKLASFKSDWAANNIFLYGGLTIVGLCCIAARTQRAFAAAQR
jgi:hypothetical protein